MKKKSVYIIVWAFALVFLYSCTKDATKQAALVNCSTVNAVNNTFNLNINPNIVSVYCAYSPCHAGGAPGGGIDMSTYAGTVSAFQTKNVICAVKGAGCELMPKNLRALPDSLILQMECWQQNGFPQ